MKPVKPKDGAIVFAPKQKDWRVEMARFLAILSETYRTEISDGEAELWMEMLVSYSFEEIKAAATDLMRNPPKQQLENGEIQAWTGMPKLPDLMQAIEEKRQERRRQADLKRQAEQSREMDDLRKRREAGEEFFGIADVIADFAKEKPELYEKHMGGLEAIKDAAETGRETRSGKMAGAMAAPLTDEQLDKRREELRRQAAEVMRRESGDQIQ